MHILRFIFPFLFARNWYNGAWEFSRARSALFVTFLLLLLLALGIVYLLQAPVTYEATPSV